MENKRSFSHVSAGGAGSDAKRPTRVRSERTQRNHGRLWLDTPPPEVRSRIAKMVCRGRPNKTALHLAETNAIQQEAVLDALSYKLDVSGDVVLSAARWISLFANDIREISLGHIHVFPWDIRSSILALFKAPTLRHAQVCDDPDTLHALANSTSIQELLVRLDTIGSQHLLLQTLKTLTLTRLELYSYGRFASECPFNELTNVSSDREALHSCCPRISSLKMSCSLSQHTHHATDDPLWKVMPLFPALRDVTVETDPPTATRQSLYMFESVQVASQLLWAVGRRHAASFNALRLAVHLGSLVTQLRTHEVLTTTEIAQLVNCPSLSYLEIGVQEGAERSVFECVRSLSSLRSLKLKWSLPGAPVRMSGAPPLRLSVCTAGAMMQIAENAPNLAELELLDVKIGMTELSGILRFFGPRLKHFGTSIINQDDMPLLRLEEFIQAVTAHSSGLHSWNIDLEWLPRAHPISDWYDGSLHQQLRQVRTALHRLRRFVPFLDLYEFESQFNGMFGNA